MFDKKLCDAPSLADYSSYATEEGKSTFLQRASIRNLEIDSCSMHLRWNIAMVGFHCYPMGGSHPRTLKFRSKMFEEYSNARF